MAKLNAVGEDGQTRVIEITPEEFFTLAHQVLKDPNRALWGVELLALSFLKTVEDADEYVEYSLGSESLGKCSVTIVKQDKVRPADLAEYYARNLREMLQAIKAGQDVTETHKKVFERAERQFETQNKYNKKFIDWTIEEDISSSL